MADKISEEMFEHIEVLAQLTLRKEERERVRKSMNEMLEFMEKLKELDTKEIEPMSHIFSVENVFREDVITNKDGKEETLLHAPKRKGDGFEVPRTFTE